MPMRPARIGVTVEAVARIGPYYQANADLYECPGCKATVLWGFGRPFHHNEPGYQAGTTEYTIVLE